MFLDMSVHHLDVTTSEHKPLWIALEGMDSSYQKPFYFEQMWMTDMGCSEKFRQFGVRGLLIRGIQG